jgi:hypothetical protein
MVSQKNAERLNSNLPILRLTVCSNSHTSRLVLFCRGAQFFCVSFHGRAFEEVGDTSIVFQVGRNYKFLTEFDPAVSGQHCGFSSSGPADLSLILLQMAGPE